MRAGGQRSRSAATVALTGGVLALAVAVAIFAVGRNVTPDYTAGLFGRHLGDAVSLKARLATVVLALALVQLVLALWMYCRLPGAGGAPAAVPRVHRAVGGLAFLAAIPVAAH